MTKSIAIGLCAVALGLYGVAIVGILLFFKGANMKDYPIICAWCGKIADRTTAEDSHGICDPCKQRVFGKYLEER